MNEFKIEVRHQQGAGPDDPRPVAVRAGDLVFTRLLRPGSDQPDDYLLAPPAPLAFWLVDNWWRLRWECVPSGERSPEWRLAHELASIGGGYIWPRLAIWGEGERVGLASRSDPPGVVGPVRYLSDALLFIAGNSFEAAADAFLASAADDAAGFGSDRAALKAQFDALQAERRDPEMAGWRRLEAQSGFDPDSAPEALMLALAQLAGRYGESGVEEAVQASPGSAAADVLSREIAVANQAGWVCDFSAAIAAVGGRGHAGAQPPWRAAEEAGRRVRAALGVGSGPVPNQTLVGLLKVDPRALDVIAAPGAPLAYGLRLKARPEAPDRVALRSRWPASRRFELTRALGDAICGDGDALGPLARSKTARQKFQRAFAQNLLCPYEGLMGYIGTTDPSDEDIEAAAKHFDVSERVVQTTLVNNNVVERARFEEMVDEAA